MLKYQTSTRTRETMTLFTIGSKISTRPSNKMYFLSFFRCRLIISIMRASLSLLLNNCLDLCLIYISSRDMVSFLFGKFSIADRFSLGIEMAIDYPRRPLGKRAAPRAHSRVARSSRQSRAEAPDAPPSAPPFAKPRADSPRSFF